MEGGERMQLAGIGKRAGEGAQCSSLQAGERSPPLDTETGTNWWWWGGAWDIRVSVLKAAEK